MLFLASMKTVNAQQIEVQDTPPNWDAMMSNLNTTSLTRGVLYNRVGMFANLYDFNRGVFNLSHANHFLQGINELYYASNQTNFISAKQLSASIDANRPSVVDIGIVNTTIHLLNFNEKDPSTGGLTFNNDKFVPIAGRPSFLSRTILLAAPLREVATGTNVTYMFSNNLIFNFGASPIKTLTVFFDDATPNIIINNGLLTTTTKNVNYSTSGTKMIRFVAVFDDNSTITTVGYHHFENTNLVSTLTTVSPAIPCDDDLKERGVFKSTLAFKGYNEATAYYGKFDYTIFYHTKNNTALERRMIKPIIIIDGFDPGDTRKTTDCDCESDRSPKGCFEQNSEIRFIANAGQVGGVITRVFNPLNHESIEDNMLYDNGINPLTGLPIRDNLIEDLRLEGYDVIILNIPQYNTSAEGSTVENKAIDGGGDYIERNGLALASYLQNTKAKLTLNGSTENIVLMGPSMGGLISRYGLAYMEKREAEATTQPDKDLWKHNTRLWVSFDSPHLGANIPLGAQANIWFFGEKLRNYAAEEKFNNQLNSTAGKQMLIGQFSHVLNTMSGGTGFSNNSPFFVQSQNNLNTNGVAGSGGFPVSNSTFRKISIINGSLSGVKNGAAGGEYLNVRGYKDPTFGEGLISGALLGSVLPFFGTITGGILGGLFGASNANITVLRCKNNFYPAYGQTNYIFNGDGQNFAIGWSVWHINHKWYNLRGINNDLRGSMDVVPGGTFTTGKILRDEISKGLDDAGMSFEKRGTNIDEHSFISSFSSLAHLQPYQSWSNPLNTNLACTSNKQTPFDSYFGLKENTGHIKLNKDLVDWLMKELGSDTVAPSPQAPSFPINANSLAGPELICTSASYSFGDICKLPSNATWTRSPNLQITSSNGFSVNVAATPTGSGAGFIKATFQNGQTFIKNIWVGTPQITTIENCFLTQAQVPTFNVPIHADTPPPLPCDPACKTLFYNPVNNYNVPFTGFIEQIEIEKFNTNFQVTATNTMLNIMPHTVGLVDFRFRATNACGSTEWLYFKQNIVNCGTNSNQPQNVYTVYPNPSNNIVNIALRDLNNQPTANTTVTGELFDLNGQPKSTVQINNNQASFSVAGLPRGNYLLNINVNGQVEGHQIVVE